MRRSPKLVQCSRCKSLICCCSTDLCQSSSFSDKSQHAAVTESHRKKFLEEVSHAPKHFRSEVFQWIERLVDSWLYRKKKHFYNSDNAQTLTIMTLEKCMGYTFEDINNIYDGNVNKTCYELKAKRFEFTYEQMIDQIHKTIERYSNCSADSNARNQNYVENDSDRSYADWYTCNSVDRMDGSKYIGYHRREYEDSRFGSFPVHDDYSEESWADDDPWG